MFVLSCVVLFLLNTPLCFVNTSPSLPFGLYFAVPFCGRARKGDYVVLEDPAGSGRILLKRVAGFTSSGDLWLLGDSAEEIETRAGVSGLVSYDSAFFGAVPRKTVRKVFRFL